MAGVHGGGCLCGGVRYEVEGPLAAVQLCHCGQCRKAQGSAFGANLPVATAAFRLIQGEDLLREYRASPPSGGCFAGPAGAPCSASSTARPRCCD